MLTDWELETECANAVAANRKNLEEILRDNRDTEFGKKYSFAGIRTIEEFRGSVPLSRYHDYQKEIEKMRSGGENILTAYSLNGFCTTSGTDGTTKYIPVTHEAFARCGAWMEGYKSRVYAQAGHGKRLFLNFFRTDLETKQEQDLLVSEMFYRHMYETGELYPEHFAGGRELLFEKNPGDGMYAKTWIGILTEDIVVLEAIFLYDILHFFSYLEKSWEAIIRDIKNGVISDDARLSESVKNRLLACKRDPARIAYVEGECKKGVAGIAKRLWPGLALLSGVSNKAFFAEDEALEKYAGSIPRHYLCYGASECYMGEPLGENSFDYVLVPRTAFYEFIPYSADDDVTETVLPHECEPGKLYEIVITTFTGFYRYRMDDILLMKGFHKESPVFEFAFRRKHTLNIAGEKMSILQMEEAVRKMREKGIQIEAYSIGVSLVQMPAKYIALLALKENTEAEAPAEILDGALSEVNRDYMDLRQLGYLDKPVVYAVDGDRYSEITERFRKEHRHNKPLHILPEHAAEALQRDLGMTVGKPV